MNKAVQNGVSQDGIGDTQMPTRNGNLRSDQRRSMSKTVIQNFKDILGIGERDGIAHPVVDDQEAAFCIFCQGASSLFQQKSPSLMQAVLMTVRTGPVNHMGSGRELRWVDASI